MTTNASIVLQGIANEWRSLYKPFGPVLHLNDASLERGGYFDIQYLWNRGEHVTCLAQYQGVISRILSRWQENMVL